MALFSKRKNIKLHRDCGRAFAHAWRTCSCMWSTCVKSGDVVLKIKNQNITIQKKIKNIKKLERKAKNEKK